MELELQTGFGETFRPHGINDPSRIHLTPQRAQEHRASVPKTSLISLASGEADIFAGGWGSRTRKSLSTKGSRPGCKSGSPPVSVTAEMPVEHTHSTTSSTESISTATPGALAQRVSQ